MRFWQAIIARFVGGALAAEIVGDVLERCGRNGAATLRCHAAAIRIAAALAASWCASAAGSLSPALMRGVVRDAVQTGRMARRTPVASAVVVLTLAAGLGINAAVFSLVYGVLFDPLPFADSDRVAMIEGVHDNAPGAVYAVSVEDFRDFEKSQRGFESVGLAGYWTFTLADPNTPLRVLGAAVSERFFETLGTRPVLGRVLGPSDGQSGTAQVAVIGHGLWQRQFGGRAGVVGEVIKLNGTATTVVGVMPASFRFPGSDMEIWVPLANEMDGTPRNVRFLAMVGRLKGGVTPAEARNDLNGIAASLERAYPATNKNWRVDVVPALDALTSTVRPQLLLLFAAVLTVLLVAAVNLTGMLAARRAARAGDLAVRAALGASPWRLARLAMIEGGWFGAAGLVVGLPLAAVFIAELRHLAPETMPRAAEIALSGPVIFASVAATSAIAIVSGGTLLFARRRTGLQLTFESGRVAGLREAKSLSRGALIVAQVAMAFVLLCGAGLLVRSFGRVLEIDPGFQPDRLLTMRVFLGPPKYRTSESQAQYVERGLEALRAAPGVITATAGSQLPFDTEGSGTSIPTVVEGRTYGVGEVPNATYRSVAPGYFSAMGIRLRSGREFTTADGPAAPRVVVINAAMARKFWSGADPIGAKVQWPQVGGAPTMTVVGVVDDVATDGFEKSERPAMYGPYPQRVLPYLRWMTFVVRTAVAPGPMANELRAALQAADPAQPIYAVHTMDAQIGRSVAERRFGLLLMVTFAGLTLLLATMGLYGVLSQSVDRRRREIGVRLAIGAGRLQVFRDVARGGMALVLIGLLLGAGAAAAASRFVEGLLFGVTAADPVTLASISALLLVVAAVASAVPAWRASRVDPIQALRLD
jgi:putative ABC transport system permease protein